MFHSVKNEPFNEGFTHMVRNAGYFGISGRQNLHLERGEARALRSEKFRYFLYAVMVASLEAKKTSFTRSRVELVNSIWFQDFE